MRKCASTCRTGGYLWVILAAAMASGCFGDGTKPPANNSLGSGGEVVNPTVSGAPTITGAAIDEVLVGRLYKFKPTATDPDGDGLSFAIKGKPAWTQFDTKTGILSGKPQAKDVGEYTSIEISVSDGHLVTTLPAFTISVVQSADGAATLSWEPPLETTSGAMLTDLGGYRIHYGHDKTSLSEQVLIANGTVTTYVLENLTRGTWYFAIRSLNSRGKAGPPSGVVAKTIG